MLLIDLNCRHRHGHLHKHHHNSKMQKSSSSSQPICTYVLLTYLCVLLFMSLNLWVCETVSSTRGPEAPGPTLRISIAIVLRATSGYQRPGSGVTGTITNQFYCEWICARALVIKIFCDLVLRCLSDKYKISLLSLSDLLGKPLAVPIVGHCRIRMGV